MTKKDALKKKAVTKKQNMLNRKDPRVIDDEYDTVEEIQSEDYFNADDSNYSDEW